MKAVGGFGGTVRESGRGEQGEDDQSVLYIL